MFAQTAAGRSEIEEVFGAPHIRTEINHSGWSRFVSPIIDLVRRAPAAATMLILPDRTVSYGDILRRSAALAAGLSEHGIVRGDRVVVLLPNGPDWFVVMMACARIGAAMVSLNQRLSSVEIGDVVSRTRAVAIFLDPVIRSGAVAKAVSDIDPRQLETVRFATASGGQAPWPAKNLPLLKLEELSQSANGWTDDAEPDDPFWIVPTSGTTSRPKLVVHGQLGVARHVREVAEAFDLDHNNTVLLALPLCGGFGFTTALTALAAGARIVLLESFDPAEASRAIQSHGVTDTYGTNDMLAAMLASTPDERPFPTLRLYGHANFTPGLTDLPTQAERRGVFMRGMYGLSEAMAFVAAHPLDATLDIRSEGGGSPISPAARIRVRNLETGQLVAPGGSGELEIFTPTAMMGYFEDAERTAAAFTDDGYLRTGDVVQLQPDGSFLFMSRKGDMLRIGGYLVSPAEIEDVIKIAGPVAACQVVAINHNQRSRPVAFVVADDGAQLDVEALMQACERSLAIFKRPVQIFSVPSLPTNDGSNGAKVQKYLLRDLALQMLGMT